MFFRPLLWTVSRLKGGISDYSLDKLICPSTVPDALWFGRLTALGALFIRVREVRLFIKTSRSTRTNPVCVSSRGFQPKFVFREDRFQLPTDLTGQLSG